LTRQTLRAKYIKLHQNVYAPIGLDLVARARQPAPPGIVIHRGDNADDEICLVQSICCTTPARTAYDIGRRVPRDTSIILIDALLNATRCTVADVSRIADRYPGARGIRRLCRTLD
jgi:hypothetical protein